MASRIRESFFSFFVGVGERRPFTVIGCVVFVLIVALGFASRLEIQTSRFSLVDDDNEYQSRLLTFFERFGQPDAPVFVVREGTVESRRRAVDRLLSALESDPDYAGRTMGRVDSTQMAELSLLHRPEVLGGLRASLPSDFDFVGSLEAGLPGAMGMVEAQLLAGLDGEQKVDPKRAEKGLRSLGQLADALRLELKGERVGVSSLLEGMSGEDADSELESLRKGVDEEGYLVGHKGEHLLVGVFPEFPGTRVDDYRPYVDELVALRDEVEASADLGGVEILLTGLPKLTVDEQDVLTTSLWKTSLATGIGIFVILIVVFRSLPKTIIALIPIGVGTGMSLGALQLIFGHLNTVTSGFMAVLLGLGIDFSVHVLARNDESLRQGASVRDALKDGFVWAGPGVLTGAITTSLAFLTVVTAEFTAFSELGVITAVGLILTVAATFFLLPATMLGRKGLAGNRAAVQVPGLGSLPGLMRKAPKLVVLIGVVVSVSGVLSFSKAPFNIRYFDFLPSELESTRGLEYLEEDGAMSPLFAFAVAENIEEAREMSEKLSALETVGEVQSVSDLLPPLDDERRGALRAGFAGLKRNPDFEAMASRGSTVSALKGKVDAVVDALDETRFALEGAGRGSSAIDETLRAFKALSKELEGVDPAKGGGEDRQLGARDCGVTRPSLEDGEGGGRARSVCSGRPAEGTALSLLRPRRQRSGGSLRVSFGAYLGREHGRAILERSRVGRPQSSGPCDEHVPPQPHDRVGLPARGRLRGDAGLCGAALRLPAAW